MAYHLNGSNHFSDNGQLERPLARHISTKEDDSVASKLEEKNHEKITRLHFKILWRFCSLHKNEYGFCKMDFDRISFGQMTAAWILFLKSADAIIKF